MEQHSLGDSEDPILQSVHVAFEDPMLQMQHVAFVS